MVRIKKRKKVVDMIKILMFLSIHKDKKTTISRKIDLILFTLSQLFKVINKNLRPQKPNGYSKLL